METKKKRGKLVIKQYIKDVSDKAINYGGKESSCKLAFKYEEVLGNSQDKMMRKEAEKVFMFSDLFILMHRA